MSNKETEKYNEFMKEKHEEQLKTYNKTGHWPYWLECPHCNKEGVDDTKKTLICMNCKAEFTEDDICPECERLVAGSCYFCKMD